MKKAIRLTAVNCSYDQFPDEADPYSNKFDPTAPIKYVQRNLERNFTLFHDAGKKNADLVCTHEDLKGSCTYMLYLDFPELFSSFAETIPGPTSCHIGEIASFHNMYIAANYFEKDCSKIYNTSILVGRDGKLIGKYRKVHLPPFEKWRVTSGGTFPVFKTDIGNIGFATCYDLVFPEHCRIVALNGADIIIHQTAGWGISDEKLGEALIRVRAAENSVYMLVAKNLQPNGYGRCCIVDNNGDIITKATSGNEKIIISEFVPDFELVKADHFNSFFSGISSCKKRQAIERLPNLYSTIIEKRPHLLDQYEGIELNNTFEEANEVFIKWKEHINLIKNNKQVKIKYHW